MYNAALENSIRVNCTETIFTARKRSFGQGNVFTPVYDSVHRRGVCPIACGDPPPLGQTCPLDRHLPPFGHYRIRSTSGRYTSYWNALVLTIRAFVHLENDLATGYSKLPRCHNSDIKSDKVVRSVKNMKQTISNFNDISTFRRS